MIEFDHNTKQLSRTERVLWEGIREGLLLIIRAIEIYCGMDRTKRRGE